MRAVAAAAPFICAAFLTAAFVPATLVAQAPDSTHRTPSQRNPTIARALSIVPGAGHVYAGAPVRGLAFTAGWAAAGALAVIHLEDCLGLLGSDSCDAPGPLVAAVSTIAVPVLWVWSGKDAGRVAERRNRDALAPRPTVSATRVMLPNGQSARGVKVGVRVALR
jgi:hypothetical protein